MNTIYINNNTNSILSPSSMITNDEDGIIVNNSNCWQYIPSNEISKQITYDEFYPENMCPILNTDRKKKVSDNQNISTAYTDILVYDIGFKDFTVCTRIPEESSGIISKAFSVENTSYITLDSEYTGNGSIEYSILDGSNEIPILPGLSKNVIQEKLFYDLDTEKVTTRFPVDHIQGIKPILYKDGIVITQDYQDLRSSDFDGHSYYLTYTAYGNVHQYIPSMKSICLKIIVRQYDMSPVCVKNIVVHKYGGSVLWTLKASV